MNWLFLMSGLFLGWSLGANDAANIFGTAVGSKMLRFRTAALISSIFVVLGAIAGTGGTSATLSRLGAVDAIAGSFMVALAAALAVYALLRRSELPVSTTQAIVGAILGWNLFTGSRTDTAALGSLIASWLVSPLLAGAIAALLFVAARHLIARSRVHLLRVDSINRLGLATAGAIGAFTLGMNNIGNVVGVFVNSSPFRALRLGSIEIASSVDLLFFFGGVAIAVGIWTYSHRVMTRLGTSITELSPVAAFVVVISVSLVLFLFGSQQLASLLESNGLPALPLVPVSSSQAVVGAIIGIAIVRGSAVRFDTIRSVVIGWIAAPVLAGTFAFLGLFVLQNVFLLKVTS